MALRDEIKAEREKLKGQSWQKKLGYFWDYYKIPTVAVLVLLLLAGAIAREMLGKKEDAYYLLMINPSQIDTESSDALSGELAEYFSVDTGKEKVTVDLLQFDPENYDELAIAGSARVAALFAGKSVDSFLADPKLFNYYAAGGAFQDLRTLYEEETLNSLQEAGRLVYLDLAAIEAREKAQSEAGEETEPTFSDTLLLSPEDCGNPVPMGILYPAGFEGGTEGALKVSDFYRGDAVFSIVANSTRLEKAKSLQAYFG